MNYFNEIARLLEELPHRSIVEYAYDVAMLDNINNVGFKNCLDLVKNFLETGEFNDRLAEKLSQELAASYNIKGSKYYTANAAVLSMFYKDEIKLAASYATNVVYFAINGTDSDLLFSLYIKALILNAKHKGIAVQLPLL